MNAIKSSKVVRIFVKRSAIDRRNRNYIKLSKYKTPENRQHCIRSFL